MAIYQQLRMCTALQMIPRPEMIPDRKWYPELTANHSPKNVECRQVLKWLEDEKIDQKKKEEKL